MTAQLGILILVLSLAVVGGCGSDDDSESTQDAEATSVVNGSPTDLPAGDQYSTAEDTDIDPDVLREVAELTPHEVVASYREDCSAADQSSPCRALRRRIEYLYLEVLLDLRRAGQQLDAPLYRVAAHAENPQLSILGVRGLMLAAGPVAEEDQRFIVSRLDSPYPGVRATVMQFGGNVAGVRALWPRCVADPTDGIIPYLDVSRDRQPDPRIVAGYPGARFRYFASTDARAWFTTDDSSDEVIEFLTRDGGEALAGEALNAKIQADGQAKYMEAAMSGDPEKLAAALQNLTKANVDWPRMMADVAETGEIRYVPLGSGRMLAVFDDHVLGTTSIVSLVAPPAPEAPRMDSEEAINAYMAEMTRTQRMEQILERRLQ